MNPFRSWLGMWNFLFLQWLFIRLQSEGFLNEDGVYVHQKWSIRRWVVPMTGWWTSYIEW